MRPLIVAKSALKGVLGEISKICLHSEVLTLTANQFKRFKKFKKFKSLRVQGFKGSRLRLNKDKENFFFAFAAPKFGFSLT